MSSIFVWTIHCVVPELQLYLMVFFFLFLTVEPLDLTDYHYSFLGSQEYQPREESMSTTPREDDSSRTLIPSKLGKQAVGICAAPNTPCSRKVGAVEAEVISSDDDFEKIAYPKKGKSAAATVVGRGGKNAVITRRNPAIESGNITSSKRAARLPMKWRSAVAPLNKYSYPHLSEARRLKQYVLSEDGLKKYSE
jgi:hypothetical protein